jgi:hypothetical protein
MKKNKLKNYLKLGILLFGISIFLVNCQKDNVQELQETKASKKPLNLTATIQRGGKLIESNKALKEQLVKFIKSENNAVASRTIYSSEYDFSIDTTYVQLIETATYNSFTFIVERENPNPDILENYVFTSFNNGNTRQYLISYPIVNSDSDQEFDIANATIQSINDDSLIFSRESSCASLVEYEDPVCVDYNCTAGDNHSVGQTCNGSPGEQPYTECTGGGWVDQGCPGTSGGGTGSDYASNDTTNGGNTSTDTNTDNTTEDEVVIPFGNKAECKKVTDFLNSPDNTAFKQKLNDFANPANFPQNLDIEFEKSVSIFENETALDEREGTPLAAEVEILVNPTNSYKAFLHTHPNDTEGTYSVFSFDDLIAISKILANDKIDTGTFVAFLLTKKGDSITKYALTINNKTKFKEFFYYVNNKDTFDYNTATQDEKDKMANSLNITSDLRKRFYDGDSFNNVNPRINNFNVNSEQMLTEFLKLMEETDMGTTMFEATPSLDGSIDNYSPLTLDGSDVIRKPCNN